MMKFMIMTGILFLPIISSSPFQLHSYYTTGKPLLDDDEYDELHDNLTWEGSSVATMSADEIKFVSAVAAAKRGEPMMDDEEYLALKSGLKEDGSWVVNREQDALEKNGLNTFMGYLHRSMQLPQIHIYYNGHSKVKVFSC